MNPQTPPEIAAPEALPLRLEIASLQGHEAFRFFHVRESHINPFEEIPCSPIPQYLKDNIARIYHVTNAETYLETAAISRTILDQLLIWCLYEEGQIPAQEHEQPENTNGSASPHLPTEEDPAKLELLHDMPLSKVVRHEGETKLLSEFADYSVWYDRAAKKTLATNLVILGSKRYPCTDAALPQLRCYMGIIHSTRKEESKENCVVYGAVSDGKTFRFCRIDNDGFYGQSCLLEWRSQKHQDQIYSIVRFFLREAALSSPSTTPIKDPMRRRIVLSSFGKPKPPETFDSIPWTVYYEDELDSDCEIVDLNWQQ
ncbi:uncharacterized protein BP5553_08306 [Venustampulla echinocandica]|uniref:Uncharacterized protein n=1 Tax=Venustampulla echinocandica TaxID=2656787 RepID=A0A370TGA6_9HELO|nr:uncharacterized protein BP5553_08306 [Venustampulla echinocandica]RDL33938.1 hypothetical protein BP5553_08306 [Venustampulla echinocandica]